MQAVIMAGGRGQRLQPLTLRRPKPLVPLFGRPLLGRLLEALARQGVDEVFITAGYLGGQVHDFVSTLRGGQDERGPLGHSGSAGRSAPLRLPRLHVAVEAQPRGTAGAVADLLGRLRSPFAVLSGDAVLDIDLAALVRSHVTDGNAATLCLAPGTERLRFGTVALEGRRIVRFLEKPSLGDLLPDLGLNTGCYVLDHRALAGVAPGVSVDFALDVFPRLLREGVPLGACQAARFWRDIGTLDAYRQIHFDGLSSALPWEIERGWPLPSPAPGLVPPVHLGRNVTVGSGAQIVGPTIIGDGCHIGDGATVNRSVLLGGAVVGQGASLTDCVVDEGASIPPHHHLAQAGVAGCADRTGEHARPEPEAGRSALSLVARGG